MTSALGGRPRAIVRVPEAKRAEVLALARKGRPLELIADKLGISRETLRNATNRGREALARKERGEALDADDESELLFVSQLLAARAERAGELQDGVEAGGGDVDWRALAWSLERTHGDVFGPRSKTEITGAEGGPVVIEGRAPMLFIPAKDGDD